MIKNKNFMNIPIADIPVDDEYFRCNFSQPQPEENAGVYTGVRLFPGDDTPRVFTKCNLVNCEPPPGSTLVSCNTAIMERDVVDHTDRLIIAGVVVETNDILKNIVHGRILLDSLVYEYKATPEEIFLNDEEGIA